MPPMPGVHAQPGVNGAKRPIGDVLTEAVRENAADGATRFDAASSAIGHFVRQYHDRRIGKDEMWELICGWNEATLRPPWDQARLERETNAILKRDAEKRHKGNGGDPPPNDGADQPGLRGGNGDPSEEQLATMFADRHSRERDLLRYNAEFGKWVAHLGKVWRTEKTLRAFHFSREICKEQTLL